MCVCVCVYYIYIYIYVEEVVIWRLYSRHVLYSDSIPAMCFTDEPNCIQTQIRYAVHVRVRFIHSIVLLAYGGRDSMLAE